MTRLLLTVGLLIGSVGLAYGQLDPNDAYRLNQMKVNDHAVKKTPEEIQAAKEKRQAEREASAVVPEGMAVASPTVATEAKMSNHTGSVTG